MGTVLTVIFYALIMALVLGVLVFVHEFGHFIFARKSDVQVANTFATAEIVE